MDRAPEIGNRLGTPASTKLGRTALFIGVPIAINIAKTSSRWTSLLAAWIARGTW